MTAHFKAYSARLSPMSFSNGGLEARPGLSTPLSGSFGSIQFCSSSNRTAPSGPKTCRRSRPCEDSQFHDRSSQHLRCLQSSLCHTYFFQSAITLSGASGTFFKHLNSSMSVSSGVRRDSTTDQKTHALAPSISISSGARWP